jgi:uncharacterized protein
MNKSLKSKNDLITIRDPVHGSIFVTPYELELIDQPAFQRLRNIKQLGFTDLAFPGATHSRYSHSIGAMHLATRVFDILFANIDLPHHVQARFRQTVRLAMLFHDIGHSPLSHTTEMMMPQLKALDLKNYQFGNPHRQATHEDYALKLITDSSFSHKITQLYGDDGLTLSSIAELINDKVSGNGFMHQGINYAPALRQIVTSECDADRMDYLQRDSFYCGVNYGKFDTDWLIDNIVPIEQNNSIYLGIKSRAIFSFEDFLLSRYHMFASVYLHYTPVIFEKLLQKYIREENSGFFLPADIEQYIAQDDLNIWQTLRQSKNYWARRIVERKPYFLLYESHLETPPKRREINEQALYQFLLDKKIDCIQTSSKSILSKYVEQGRIPLYVLTKTNQVILLEDYTTLYTRYKSPAVFHRIFVVPEQKDQSLKILATFIDERNANGTKTS